MEVSSRENPWYTEKQVWVFRAGLEDEFVNTFRSNNVIGIYWNIEQDLALVNDWEELTEMDSEAILAAKWGNWRFRTACVVGIKLRYYVICDADN